MDHAIFFLISFLIGGSVIHFTYLWNQSIDEELRQVRLRWQIAAARQKQEEARRRREAYARARFYRAGSGRSRGFTHYERVLGLPTQATPAEIKKTYRRLVVRHHPDKAEHLGPSFRDEAERRMKEINEAYDFFRRRYSLR